MLKKKRRRSIQFKSENRFADKEEARKRRQEKRESITEANGGKVKSRKRMKRTKKARLIYSAIIITMIAFVCVAIFSVMSLKVEEQKIMAEKAALLSQKERLEYELLQIDSLEYVEQQARQLLKMIKPGEILYILPQKENLND